MSEENRDVWTSVDQHTRFLKVPGGFVLRSVAHSMVFIPCTEKEAFDWLKSAVGEDS